MSEARFTVHPGQLSSRSKTTWWVRDRLDPKWPSGPYRTRENAEVIRGANELSLALGLTIPISTDKQVGTDERTEGVKQNPLQEGVKP